MRRTKDLAGITIFVLVLLLIGSCCESQNEGRSPAPVVEGPRYNVPAGADDTPMQGQTSSLAPIKFASSGRLPTRLHGFELGMSGFDAKKREPSLRSSTPLEGLHTTLSDGFSVHLSFSRNQLYEIESTLNNVTPQEADAFDRNTLMQLGKPDQSVYKGPEAKCWVWIDDDVRASYEDRENDEETAF